ncbi:MAG: hypothetical protein M3Y58_19025 [Chloroflexota bacterium]|nr:hypothetical protein [Chloroflexota bacterium]
MMGARPDSPNPSTLWEALNTSQRAVLQRAAISAEQEGGKAFLVGGPVRDLLRGDARLHDIDIVTTADARRVAQRFATMGNASVAKRTDFGTATVRVSDGDSDASVDFATARTETYPQPGALPVVAFPAQIGEDLHRRDVSINAMALPITPHGFGRLLDPTGGLADLRAGVIRVLHDGSFRDDPTRLYRAARYAARFGFTIEPHTASLLHAAVADGALTTISPDRKRHGLALGIRERDPIACFDALDRCGLLRATSPALVWDAWVATRMRHVAPTAWPIWAFFVCRQNDAAVEQLLADIPVGTGEQVRIRMLVRVWRERDGIAKESRLSALRSLLERLPERDVLAVLAEDPAAAHTAAFYARRHDLWSQDYRWGRSFGNYLKELGVMPGPVYRDVLDALRDARLDGDVETREEAETFVRKRLIGPVSAS